MRILLKDLQPSTSYGAQFRTVGSTGEVSDWSITFPVTTINDTTPPPVPSTPVVSPHIGQLKVSWDGLGVASAPMPLDFAFVEIHASSTNGFTPSTSTLKGTLEAKGEGLVAGLTYGTQVYVKLVSVDLVGNRSAASAQATGTPVRVSGIDVEALAIATTHLGDGAVTGLKIADATITSAKIGTAQILNANIANLAVDDAKVANMNVGKLVTGTLNADVTVSSRIKTSDTGARVEINSAGLQAYGSGGVQTVNVSSVDGSVQITGAFKTGFAGGGSAFLEMTDSVDRSTIKFFEQTGSRSAYINSPVGSGGQVGIAANSGNFDLVTGNLSGGIQGFARLYMNHSFTQLGRVTSSEVAHGPELLMAPAFATLSVQNLDSAHGGRLYLDDNFTELTVKTNNVQAAAGRFLATRSYGALSFTNSSGAAISEIVMTEASGCYTVGKFGSNLAWSTAPVGGWAIVNFRLDRWGPFVVLNTTIERTGSALAAGPHGSNVMTITTTPAGAFNTSFISGVMLGSSTNHGYATINSGGTLQISYLAAPLATSGQLRCTSVWWT